MKAVLFLLAVVCFIATGQGGPIDPCLDQCKDATYAKLAEDPFLNKLTPSFLTSETGRASIHATLTKYMNGESGLIPDDAGTEEKWTKLCTIGTEGETCVNACPNSPLKEESKKMLAFSKLGCDPDIKSSISCLVDAQKEPSTECQTKCAPLGAKFKDFLTTVDTNAPSRPAPKDALDSFCKFMNCRLNCRKPEVVNKCQEKGFESLKKLLVGFIDVAKMVYKKKGGDLSNFSDECDSDEIIKPD